MTRYKINMTSTKYKVTPLRNLSFFDAEANVSEAKTSAIMYNFTIKK